VSSALFSIVFAEISGGPASEILADLALMQHAPDEHPRTAPDLDSVPEEVVPYVKPEETGGPSGPEPTRFGDWERKGRCIDF
jgi:hypothetical protein